VWGKLWLVHGIDYRPKGFRSRTGRISPSLPRKVYNVAVAHTTSNPKDISDWICENLVVAM
jgi:hypothetical protein